MLKIVWTILVLSLSFSAFAEDPKGRCRYDLLGPKTLPDSILEPMPLTRKECEAKAIKLLKLNKENYDKAIIFFSNEPHSTLIQLKNLKEE